MNSPQEYVRWLATPKPICELVCLFGGCPAIFMDKELYSKMRDPSAPASDVFAYVPEDTPGAPRTGWFILDPRGEEL